MEPSNEGSTGNVGADPQDAVQHDLASGWRRPAARAALLGGVLAIAATVALFFHLAGRSGLVVGWGFALAAVALAAASVALGATPVLPRRARQLRSWALLGAAGFLVSGVGLLADLADWPIVLSEVMAVLAVGGWWAMMAWHVLRKPNVMELDAQESERAFGYLSGAFALLAIAAVGAHFMLEVPSGAAPVRMAYVLWGPWGLALARRVARGPVLV
jgi:hypothetical protein